MSQNQPPARYVNAAGQPELPQHAKERLATMREHHFFTSDLSVNEFLLVNEVGFQPVGLVMGSSIYHVGWQQVRPQMNEELTMLTQALYQSRELAMERMEEEADALGADGIVGVRLTVAIHTFSANVIEFLAIGTAVKHEQGQNWRAPNGKPFTSDLTGQDFWTLLHAGYRPLGFVMGNCVYHIAQAMQPQQQQGYGNYGYQYGAVVPGQMQQNGELTNYTQGIYDARELAMERMQAEAEELGAAGIVGVVVDESNHTWGANVLEFSAVGTAVIAISKDHQIPKPTLIMTVND